MPLTKALTNEEIRFNIVNKEVQDHLYIGKTGSGAHTKSALEEFFWGTYDKIKRVK